MSLWTSVIIAWGLPIVLPDAKSYWSVVASLACLLTSPWTWLPCVRYRSPMDLWQVHPALSSSIIPFHFPSPFLFLLHLWHSSIRPCFPLSHPSSLCSLFHWYPFLCHYDPLISCLSFLPPIPVFSCFMLVPFVLVPDQVKPTLQHRVS